MCSRYQVTTADQPSHSISVRYTFSSCLITLVRRNDLMQHITDEVKRVSGLMTFAVLPTAGSTHLRLQDRTRWPHTSLPVRCCPLASASPLHAVQVSFSGGRQSCRRVPVHKQQVKPVSAPNNTSQVSSQVSSQVCRVCDVSDDVFLHTVAYHFLFYLDDQVRDTLIYYSFTSTMLLYTVYAFFLSLLLIEHNLPQTAN